METKKRIATALVLIPVLIYCVFFLVNEHFRWAMTFVMVLGFWEWSRLIGIKDKFQQGVYIVGSTLLAYGTELIPSTIVYAFASVWWFFALYLVMAFPKSQSIWKDNFILQIVIGWLIVIPTWLGVVQLQGQNIWNLVLVFVLIFSADSGAYFAGRQFGKNKLAPEVSPGKSIEGVLGGLVVAVVAALVVQRWTDLTYLSFVASIILFVAVILFSVLGDLSQSMFKRVRGVKDSSNLLPGHGGILDRIDSLTSAVPIYFFFLFLLEQI